MIGNSLHESTSGVDPHTVVNIKRRRKTLTKFLCSGKMYHKLWQSSGNKTGIDSLTITQMTVISNKEIMFSGSIDWFAQLSVCLSIAACLSDSRITQQVMNRLQ